MIHFRMYNCFDYFDILFLILLKAKIVTFWLPAFFGIHILFALLVFAFYLYYSNATFCSNKLCICY